MPKKKVTNSAPSFFDKYAHEYDELTNARQRTKYHTEEVASLIKAFDPTSVLDAGCASGLTSSLFARAGVKAVGLDRSLAMLKFARKKYNHLGLPLTFKKGDFEALPDNLKQRFDLVVSLANSVSGLETITKLNRAMKQFYATLQPGGALVIQMLNYSSIAEQVLMPVRATRSAGLIYIRYALRQGRKFSLHVVRVDNRGKEPAFEAFCHDTENFSPAEVRAAFKQAGFVSIKRYANLHLNQKFDKTSRDLVLVGNRPDQELRLC